MKELKKDIYSLILNNKEYYIFKYVINYLINNNMFDIKEFNNFVKLRIKFSDLIKDNFNFCNYKIIIKDNINSWLNLINLILINDNIFYDIFFNILSDYYSFIEKINNLNDILSSSIFEIE